MVRFNRGYQDKLREILHKSPGLYILLGQKASYTKQPAYIGQTSDVYRRVNEHDKKKDFWIECVVFIYKGDYPFTKDQISYLEFLSIGTSLKVASFDILENCQIPNPPVLSGRNREFIENVFNDIQVLLRVFGINIFGKVEIMIGPTKSKTVLKRVIKAYKEEQEAWMNTEIHDYSAEEMMSEDTNVFYLIGSNYRASCIYINDNLIIVSKGGKVAQANSTDKKRVETLKKLLENQEIDMKCNIISDIKFDNADDAAYVISGLQGAKWVNSVNETL